MIRGIANFLAVAAFVLLLPFFCLAALKWGSPDERWLMKVCFCVFSPLTLAMWYGLISGRRFSYAVQIALILCGYAGIMWLLKERVIGF
jgi:hypothetical protein